MIPGSVNAVRRWKIVVKITAKLRRIGRAGVT